jgi:hypothetical protein
LDGKEKGVSSNLSEGFGVRPAARDPHKCPQKSAELRKSCNSRTGRNGTFLKECEWWVYTRALAFCTNMNNTNLVYIISQPNPLGNDLKETNQSLTISSINIYHSSINYPIKTMSEEIQVVAIFHPTPGKEKRVRPPFLPNFRAHFSFNILSDLPTLSNSFVPQCNHHRIIYILTRLQQPSLKKSSSTSHAMSIRMRRAL